MNEKTNSQCEQVHTGRNARKAGLLQSSILPHVCASKVGMIERVKNTFFHEANIVRYTNLWQVCADTNLLCTIEQK